MGDGANMDTGRGPRAPRATNATALQSRRKAHIESVLRATGYDLDRAADVLGVTQAALHRWMTRLHIPARDAEPLSSTENPPRETTSSDEDAEP